MLYCRQLRFCRVFVLLTRVRPLSPCARGIRTLVNTRSRTTFQGPIDYKVYEAYGGGAGKAVSAVLNNSRATRMAIGLVAGVVVSIFSRLPLSCSCCAGMMFAPRCFILPCM